MSNEDLIWSYQDAIIEIYQTEALDSLGGLDLSYIKNGVQFYEKFHAITHEMYKYHGNNFNYFSLLDDIVFCSDQLLYFTGNLYLYKNMITDVTKSFHEFQERKVFQAYSKIPDKRFDMFTDVAFQAAYNFWDRVGDLIASFFPNHFSPSKIYFSNCLSKVPLQLQELYPYKWLCNFIKTDYSELNRKRIEIVHYTSSSSTFHKSFLEINDDEEKIRHLQHAKEELPNYFRNVIKKTVEGFLITLDLLEMINTISLTERIKPVNGAL